MQMQTKASSREFAGTAACWQGGRRTPEAGADAGEALDGHCSAEHGWRGHRGA